MTVNYIFYLLIGVLVISGCREDVKETDNDNPPLVTGDPVETENPNTHYQPAFEGQTRIGSVTTETAWTKSVIT
ncbi:MAG TPA: PQQ-dependent sugar dehydrogenase, partial [Cyclobacteriaceae bacterium]|nr:PQQ-dependent sugar dehydrogenase [Cyclobacteriaceae bacterium]